MTYHYALKGVNALDRWYDTRFNSEMVVEEPISENDGEENLLPEPPFNGLELGIDPAKCPDKGFEWKGKGKPETGKGNWVRGSERLNPDLQHGPPVGPH